MNKTQNNEYFIRYQSKLISLYKETVKILNETGIKYWAHSGTLLGVKRHDGELIPWDDDIDIMVSFDEWRNNFKHIKRKLESSNLILMDQVMDGKNKSFTLKIAKVFSSESIKVDNTGNDDIDNMNPFIDIFFAVPSNSRRSQLSWWWYESMYKMMWIWQPGFDRYTKHQNNKRKKFTMNFITWPLKLILWSPIMEWIIYKPFNKKKGWDKVRRADFWSSRKVTYDLKDGMEKAKFLGEDILISKEWEKELKSTFGENWKEPVYKNPHIFQRWRINTKFFSETKEAIKRSNNEEG